MKKFALYFIVVLFVGCKSEKNEKSNHPPPTSSLTNEELLRVLGGQLFEVTVPSHVTRDHFACLAIRASDGSIKPMNASMSGLIPGEVVKIVCFPPEDDTLKYTILNANHCLSGIQKHFPSIAGSQPNAQRVGLKEGDALITFSRSPGKNSSEPMEIIFHVYAKPPGGKMDGAHNLTESEGSRNQTEQLDQIIVSGYVEKPGLYNFKQNESMADVINRAGIFVSTSEIEQYHSGEAISSIGIILTRADDKRYLKIHPKSNELWELMIQKNDRINVMRRRTFEEDHSIRLQLKK